LLRDTGGIQLTIGEKVGLVLPDVLPAQPVGRHFVVLSELLDGTEVDANGNLRQIPTLEFFQHRFS